MSHREAQARTDPDRESTLCRVAAWVLIAIGIAVRVAYFVLDEARVLPESLRAKARAVEDFHGDDAHLYLFEFGPAPGEP